MPSRSETISPRVVIQSKGNGGQIDIYRIGRHDITQETFPGPKEAAEVIQEKTSAAKRSALESGIYSGINTATAAILCFEALKRRSKLLAATSLVLGAGALYAGRRRASHMEDLGWLEQESMALELYDDEHPSAEAPKE